MSSMGNEDNSSNIDHLMSLLSSGQRTQMHTKSINSWLRKRFQSQTSLKYLYFPEELLQHENIKEIFQSFDRDNSHSLDIGELVKMFKQFNINMEKEDLKKLFDVMDQDKDNALNFDEFKNCALSEKGQQVFNQIMKKVRKEDQKRPTKDRNVYLPTSFSAMITYISYRSMRKDVLDQVVNKDLDMDVRTGKFANLINLQDLYRKDIKTDETSKLKEKIMLKNTNFANIKVEPLLRQLSNMRDFQLKSPELLNNLENSLHRQESPFFSGRKSVLMEESERSVGELRKSIEKLQRSSRKSIEKLQRISNKDDTAFNIKILPMESLKEEKNPKQEILVEEEVVDLKKSAEQSGKLKAVRLFNIGNIEKKAESVDLKKLLNLEEKKTKEEPPKARKSLGFKRFEKIMYENLKMVENGVENKKFKSLLGVEENINKGKKIMKFRRPKAPDEFKSLDLKEDSKILKRMKEINKRAFDVVLPKLEEIRKIQKHNDGGNFQKLPEIKIFQKNN